MPLLGTNRFECQPIPDDLSLEDEVYVCKATGEVFTDYEKFFDQTILCNSLIWTCGVTGHTGMTFTEALESEKNSRKQLEIFPPTLHLPILHLVSLTRRTIFKDLLDDIFGFVKDRYFVGETVTVSTGSEKKVAVVIKVFPMSNSFNQPLGEPYVDGFIESEGVKKNSMKRRYPSDSSSFHYMTQDQKTGVAIMSISKNMSRNRNFFNRDSCKLFLKEHCEHKGKGIWKLKDSVIKKYNLNNVKFSDYFAGPIPTFPGLDEPYQMSANLRGHDKKDSNLKKREGESAKDWLKPRDDLLCDDLKDLPAASPVMLFDKCFGSAIVVMEFLSSFGSFCGIELPDNFSIFELDKCLKKQECHSLFVDLLQGLLNAIFQMQLGIPEVHHVWKVASKGINFCHGDSDLLYSLTLVQFFQMVEKKSKSQKYHSSQDTSLKRLPLNCSSLTEVLRLHLLISSLETSSQSECALEMNTRHIASDFSRANPEIMKKLCTGNVLDLKPVEKLKLLDTLIDQVLGLPSCRDYLDEMYIKLKSSQKDLRNHIWAVQKRERDLFNYSVKKRQDEEITVGRTRKDFTELTTSNCHDNGNVTRAKKRSILDLKDKDFEDMPMEGIDWDQLTQEEKNRIKNWSERRQIELQNLVLSAQDDYCITPLGMDRSYRRYWIFRSVAGLFVEDSKVQDFTIPLECLNLITQNASEAKNINACNIKDVIDNEEIGRMSLNNVDAREQLTNRGKTEWSFYSTPEDFENLIKGLNDRGHRESNLKNCLVKSKQKILKSMISCDVESLTKTCENFEKMDYGKQDEFENPCAKIMKGELDLARTVIELILGLEERIFTGSLGHLKLKNVSREEWRKKLEMVDCNHSCGITEGTENEVIETLIHNKIIMCLKQCLVDLMEMVDSKYLGLPLGGDDEELKQKKSRSFDQQQQFAEGINKMDDIDASNSQESFQSVGNLVNNHFICYKADTSKWMELVSRCSNLSQLYLCLFLLDISIRWSKSLLNAHCKICRKKKDGENMLLCDKCDQGHHLYCLKPPLQKIPEGDWFCPSCQPKNVIMVTARKVPKNARYKDYNSDLGDDDEDEESLASIEINEEPLNEWKDDVSARRNQQKRKYRDKISKKVNVSNLVKNKETSVSAFRSTMYDQSVPQSMALSEFPENVRMIQHSSQSLRSRSGREIIRPRSNKQFINEELPLVKWKAREKTNNNIDPGHRKRRNVKNKYNDDFDYNNEESDDFEEMESPGRRESQKKRQIIHSFENGIPPTRSKRFAKLAPKHSHRKSNASMKAIEDLVSDLMKNDNAWPFLKPVTLKQAPDYFDIIERPIDLSTIKYKIYRFEYEGQNQIIDDLRLMLYNCNLYNCPNTPVHDAGVALEAYLNKKLEDIEKHSTRMSLETNIYNKTSE